MSSVIPFQLATAGQTVKIGPFVSTSDGVTVVTTAISANDIQLLKHNQTGLVSKNSGGATYLANGYYYITLDATDTNAAGRLQVHVNMTSSAVLPVWFDATVMKSNSFLALYSSSTAFVTDVISVAGSTTGANVMSSSALSINNGTVVSTVSAPTVSTMAVTMAVTMPTDGQLQNRQVIFDRATGTAGLRLQAAQVSTWTAATSTMVLTPPFSVSPAHNDTFGVY